VKPLFPRVAVRPTPMDMTPFVDVVLTLVLFFMLTSAFVIPFGVAVDVPAVANAESIPGAAVEVQILAGDRIVVGGREVSIEQLRKELESFARLGRPVLITGDRSASLGRTLEVWDACKSAGVQTISIRTDWKLPKDSAPSRSSSPRSREKL
jgi:biopolymer transport protein ExbD